MILNPVVKKGGIDTSQDTVTPEVLLSPYTAHNAEGNSITGTMVNRGAVTGTISTKAGQYTIPAGYHNGSGKVGISSTEKNKIIASNIKSGVKILGVTGTAEGSWTSTGTVTVKVSSTIAGPTAWCYYLSSSDSTSIKNTNISATNTNKNPSQTLSLRIPSLLMICYASGFNYSTSGSSYVQHVRSFSDKVRIFLVKSSGGTITCTMTD